MQSGFTMLLDQKSSVVHPLCNGVMENQMLYFIILEDCVGESTVRGIVITCSSVCLIQSLNVWYTHKYCSGALLSASIALLSPALVQVNIV